MKKLFYVKGIINDWSIPVVFLKIPYNKFQTVGERIKQLRMNLLIHSYLYYKKDCNIITDQEWQKMAEELSMLQLVYGYQINIYDEMFKDWDGTTGSHLSYDKFIIEKANRLRKINNV